MRVLAAVTLAAVAIGVLGARADADAEATKLVGRSAPRRPSALSTRTARRSRRWSRGRTTSRSATARPTTTSTSPGRARRPGDRGGRRGDGHVDADARRGRLPLPLRRRTTSTWSAHFTVVGSVASAAAGRRRRARLRPARPPPDRRRRRLLRLPHPDRASAAARRPGRTHRLSVRLATGPRRRRDRAGGRARGQRWSSAAELGACRRSACRSSPAETSCACGSAERPGRAVHARRPDDRRPRAFAPPAPPLACTAVRWLAALSGARRDRGCRCLPGGAACGRERHRTRARCAWRRRPPFRPG